MTNRWQSPVGLDYSEWASDLSAATSRPIRTLIPIGTVASRITNLQNLAEPSTYNGPPSTTRRESSKTGFGRLTTTRFGQSTSRTSRPDEQLQVNVENASLSPGARRSSHMEEHAVVDTRKKLDRAAGLHAQLLPNGRHADVPYDVTSPWAFLPVRSSKKNIPNQGKKNSDNSNDSVVQLGESTPIPALSNQPSDGTVESGAAVVEKELGQAPGILTSLEDPQQQRLEPSSESFSTESTSTMRRQSARDLYAYYGIQRPPGLMSPKSIASASKDTPQNPKKYVCCHLCFWANSLKSVYCKCGHQICAACEGILSDAGTKSSRNTDGTGSTQRPFCDLVERKIGSSTISEPKIKTKFPNQGEMPQRRVLGDDLGHGQYDLGGSAPALRAEGATPNRGTQKHNTACKGLFDAVIQNQGSSMTLNDSKLITASTLLSTNALLPGYSLGLLPVAMSTNTQPDQSIPCTYHVSKPHRSQANPPPDIDVKEGVFYSELPCYKVSRSSHARCRESSYPKKRRHRPNETDSGYAAGVSHLDERNTMGQESHSADEDLRHVHLDRSASKALKQCGRAMAAPQSEIERSKQGHSSYSRHSNTCLLGDAPSILKHTNIYRSPKTEHVHDGSPVTPVSIHPKQHENQYTHDVSQRTYHDERCYSCSEHQSISSSHTVRQDHHPDSFGMVAQAQIRTSSSKASSKTPSSETSINTDRPVATLTSQESTGGLWRTTAVSNAEKQEITAQGTPAANNPQLSKETFMSLKRKFEAEKSGLEAAQLPRADPSSISQATPSDEPHNQAERLKDRPSYESISIASNQPSGVCSSHKHKSTSRRLSAFFRLQEQNIVSTLNKRLQEHQEALKRMDSLCNGQLKLTRRGDSPTLEEVGPYERNEEREDHLPGTKGKLADRSEDCTPSRLEQKEMQDRRLQGNQQISRNGKGQEAMLLGLDTPKIVVETHWDGEHRHQWKRMVVQSTATAIKTPEKIQEERYVGVNGITITIHMDNREDIVIKADLSG